MKISRIRCLCCTQIIRVVNTFNMNKNLLSVAILSLVLLSCLRDDTSIYMDSANFNEDHRILSINYEKEPDTALRQIIYQSGARKNGYGIILNVDNSLSANEIKQLTYDFQLHDINAVHSFNVQSGEKPKSNILVAIEQARFVWVFSENMYNLSGSDCQPVVKALHKAAQADGILVIQDKYFEKFQECLSLP